MSKRRHRKPQIRRPIAEAGLQDNLAKWRGYLAATKDRVAALQAVAKMSDGDVRAIAEGNPAHPYYCTFRDFLIFPTGRVGD
jgi:hypothetical protein